MTTVRGNPAKCPNCGGQFSVEHALASGMPMRKLEPGQPVVCVDCWTLAIANDDGETLRKIEDADILAIGRAKYAKIEKTLAIGRGLTTARRN